MTETPDLLLRRLRRSTPPPREHWPDLARVAQRNLRPGRGRREARFIEASECMRDGSVSAAGTCKLLRERRQLTRELWLAWRQWSRRWHAFEDDFTGWRLNGNRHPAEHRHGGKHRDVKRAKARRQARKKARARR
jgi:hypothetical protein